jgi:hypothetical protein
LTSTRFDILVTDESGMRAEAIAPLLEASYAYWGNWDGLDELLNFYEGSGLLTALFEEPWVSDVDWWQIAVETLALDEDSLFEQWEQSGNLAAVAREQDIAPDVLFQAIVDAEQAAAQEVIENGELTTRQADEELGWITESAYDFVWGMVGEYYENQPDWDAIIANALGMSVDELFSAEEEGFFIAEIAEERGIEPSHLVDHILETEEDAMLNSRMYTPQEIEWQLAEIKSWAWEWIDPATAHSFVPDLYVDVFTFTDEGVDWLLNALLLEHERLLVADIDGVVVYDSLGEFEDEQLP